MLSEEKKNERPASAGPRYRYRSKTDNRCWREAVFWFAGEDEPCLCAEHTAVVEANDEVADWYTSLQTIDEWIKKTVDKTGDTDLQRLAYNMRDEARREYGILATRARAAEMIAARGEIEPGGVSLTLEQEEEIARRMMREEALNAARAILEDAHEDDFELRDRWATIDALGLASADAAEEVERYKEELGISE